MTTNSSTVNPKQITFRSTTTFKPFKGKQQLKDTNRQTYFSIRFQRTVAYSENIRSQVQKCMKSARWWRLYFDKSLQYYQKDELVKLIGSSFEFLLCNDQLQQNKNSGLLINVNNLLIERMNSSYDVYIPSNLDYHCIIVHESLQKSGHYLLDLYSTQEIRQNKYYEFNCAVSIKIKEEYLPFYLVCKNKMIYLLKDPIGYNPQLQIKQSNLQQTVADISQNMLIIKNLSPRIIGIKFQQSKCNRSNEPLHVLISNSEIYQSILFRINRIKYHKYHIENRDGQSWDYPDSLYKIEIKMESKMTQQKLSPTLHRPQIPASLVNKFSNLSSRFSELPSNQTNGKKMTINCQKSLKVSRQMEDRQKYSNLVTSEMAYPVSAQDKKDRDTPYFDQFQDLLFEQQVSDEKKLILNDSFEQFQKNENSEKNKEIIEQLNRRKQRQLQLKKIEECLKQKIRYMIVEQKQLIDQNIQLKMDIKKFKISQTPIQKKIEHMKTKIQSLKTYQLQLLQDLGQIKKEPDYQILTVNCDNKFNLQSTQNVHNQNMGHKKSGNIPDNTLKHYDIRQTGIVSQSLVSTVNDDRSLYNNYLKKFGSNKFNSKPNLQSMASSLMQDIDQSGTNTQDSTRYSVIATRPVRHESDLIDGITGFMSLIYASDGQK